MDLLDCRVPVFGVSPDPGRRYDDRAVVALPPPLRSKRKVRCLSTIFSIPAL